MTTEEQNTEQNNEGTPAFSFKEVAVSETDQLFTTDVVEIPDEVETTDPPADVIDPPNVEAEEQDPPAGEQDVETEENDEVVDLNEDLAFEYLKNQRGLEFESVDDFLKAVADKKIDPEFEKFQEYKAKTGRDYGDFLQTQKDWTKESPEAVIKAVLRLDNPDLSNEDIDFLFEKDYSFDESVDDDNDIRLKQISLKVDSKKALAVLEKQKEDYMIERGSDESDIPETYKEARKLVDRLYDEQLENERVSSELRGDFVTKTQSALNDKFEGFKFSIDGQDFKLKPEDVKQTREAQLDIANFQKTFFDKENRLTDAEGYHAALYFAMNREKVAEHFYNLGKTAYAEQLEKVSRNIDVEGQRHVHSPELASFTFKKA